MAPEAIGPAETWRIHSACAQAAKLGRCVMLQRFAIIPLLFGCSTALPRIYPPQFDPRAATEKALAAYDKDGDQSLSKTEATACPGIERAWSVYDSDRDGNVSADELEARFRQWLDGDTGMMNMRAAVTWNGKPLTGADVKLIPLPLLGENFRPASGKTDRYGYAFLSIAKSDLPRSQQGVFGMQVGLYRAEITHPTIQLPDRYNTQSMLGVDLSTAEANTGIEFHLTK